jgi:DnaJ domain
MRSFREALEDAVTHEMKGAPEEREDAMAKFERVFGAHLSMVTAQRRPAWATELDLELPCDAASVRRAFRRLALKTHPDRPGGSHEAFLRAKQVLEEALNALREPEVKPLSAHAPRANPQAQGWSAYA